MATCNTCKGSGSVGCPKCDGKGQIWVSHLLSNEKKECPLCHGSGVKRCGACGGSGRA